MARYPNRPGFKGPAETGREAADRVADKCGRLQQLSLEAIRRAGERGLTADETAEALEMQRWSVQPRLSELAARRRIVDSGSRRANVTGRNAIVWVVPEYKLTAA